MQSGQGRELAQDVPPAVAAQIGQITRTAFTTGLNLILLVAAVVVLASGVVALAAIRGRDFAQQHGA